MWLCQLISSHCLSMSSIRDPTEGGTATLSQWLLPAWLFSRRSQGSPPASASSGWAVWATPKSSPWRSSSEMPRLVCGNSPERGTVGPLPILGTRWEQMPDLGLGSLLIKPFVSGTIYEGASNIQLNTIARRIDAEY